MVSPDITDPRLLGKRGGGGRTEQGGLAATTVCATYAVKDVLFTSNRGGMRDCLVRRAGEASLKKQRIPARPPMARYTLLPSAGGPW